MVVNPFEPPDKPCNDNTGILPQPLIGSIGVSLFLYTIAFLMPVFDSGTPQVMYGYQAFVFAILSVKYIPTWLANPLYWFACRSALKGNFKSAHRFAMLSLPLAVCQVWMMDDAPEAGFYLWSGSIAILLTTTFFARRLKLLAIGR